MQNCADSTHITATDQAATASVTAPSVTVGFNYSTLTPEVATLAQQEAENVHRCTRRALVWVGRSLSRVKQRLDHGQFGAWLKAEFDMTERTAQNYMAAAALVAKYETVSVLQPKTLYLLAAPSTPESVRQAVAERFAAGERLPDQAVKAMIEEAKDLENRADSEARLKSRKNRRSRAERQREAAERQARWQREREKREANTAEVARILADRVQPEELKRIAAMCQAGAFYPSEAIERAARIIEETAL